MSITVIIPAAGAGKRLGAEQPKQYLELAGLPILVRTIRVFEQTPAIDHVILAVSSDYVELIQRYQRQYTLNKISAIVAGGAERQHSIWNALQHPIVGVSDIIVVHDAVRPFITPDFIDMLIEGAKTDGAVVPGRTPKDTIKCITGDNLVDSTYLRESLRLIQTPQAFRREILVASYQEAFNAGYSGTDDASLVEFAGYPVRVVEGLELNVKITTREDLLLAEVLLQQQSL